MRVKRFIVRNKKWFIIESISIVLLTAIILGIIFLNKNKSLKQEEEPQLDDNKPKVVENLKYMTIKINPELKLIFQEKYELCNDGDSDFICGDIENTVQNVELLNDDAVKIYESVQFTGMSVEDALVNICDLAKDNKIDFNVIEIETDSENINNTNIMEYLILHSQNTINYTLSFKHVENVGEGNPIEVEGTSEVVDAKTYKVTFDSAGGSTINSQTIKEGSKAKAPQNPTKEGFSFVEWDLNGNKYNFNNKITKDITLVAKWQESPVKNSEKPTKTIEKVPEVILLENVKEGLEAKIQYDKNIFIIMKNDESILAKKFSSNVIVFADLSGYDVGDYEVSLQVKDTNDGTEYTLEPAKVSIKIEPKKEVSNVFNLNENIAYYELSMTCWNYLYINPVCLNKTLSELKEQNPDYDKGLDDLVNVKDDTVINERNLKYAYYFPSCHTDSIPDNVLNELKVLPGSIIDTLDGPRIEFTYIHFKEEKYNKLIPEINYLKYSLIPEGGCGGSGDYDPDTNTLTEEVCAKYHLTCEK